MPLLADLASWSVHAPFGVVSWREAVEAKTTRHDLLNSRVHFQLQQLMTLFRLMHSTADVAAVRRLHFLLAINQGFLI